MSCAFRPPAALVAASALAALLACSGEEHHDPLRVRARSGALVELSRTAWEICREDVPAPGASERWREEHGPEGGIVSSVARYDVPGCAGTPSTLEALGTISSAKGERSVGFTGTPPAGLGSSVVATEVYVDAGAAGIGLDCYWLDDTVTPRVLYTGDPSATRDAQGYPDAFLAGGERELPYPAPR